MELGEVRATHLIVPLVDDGEAALAEVPGDNVRLNLVLFNVSVHDGRVQVAEWWLSVGRAASRRGGAAPESNRKRRPVTTRTSRYES